MLIFFMNLQRVEFGVDKEAVSFYSEASFHTGGKDMSHGRKEGVLRNLRQAPRVCEVPGL